MDEYKKFAWLYDPVMHVFLHKIRKKVTTIIRYYKPGEIVDICCGTGNQLKYLKKHGFNNTIGVDLSEPMLRQASKGGQTVNCEQQDAASLQFQDNSFDMGIISYALHEKPFEIARKIISEAERIIKPDGYLLVVDYSVPGKINFPAKIVVHIVERFAGKSHYRNFKNYLAIGGMDIFLRKYPLKEEYIFHNGATSIRLYQINKFDVYA